MLYICALFMCPVEQNGFLYVIFGAINLIIHGTKEVTMNIYYLFT